MKPATASPPFLAPDAPPRVRLMEPPKLPAEWLASGQAILSDVSGAGTVVEMDEPLERWFGLPRARWVGQNFWSLLAKRQPSWQPPVAGLLQADGAFVSVELSTTDDHDPQWFSLELARHGGGGFVRLLSVLPPLVELEAAAWDEHLRRDAARRQMYVRLLRAEAQLDNLVRRWPGVIFSQRPDLSFSFASRRIEELTGVTVEEWRRSSQHFWQVVHEADMKDLQQQLRHTTQTGSATTSTYRIRHLKTGRVAYVLEHREPVRSASGLLLGYEGVWLDVTRQVIAEKRLSNAAWKETLAVLTMGLAHDFSNIMAGIHSLSETFQSQVEEGHPFQEGLSLIRSNSMEANQLVHRILALHHGKTGERNYQDLNELVTETTELVRKIIPRRIRVETRFAPEQLPFYVDAVEFRQVFINLALNAVEAMPQGGTLSFATTRHATTPPSAHGVGTPSAHGVGTPPRLPVVCLAVADTGSGIPSANLALIFDPFFTTKAANKGSGLGLYNARLFAEKHHGTITVASEDNVGTTFHLCLPEADFTEAERELAAPETRRRTLALVGAPGPGLDRTAQFLRKNGYYVAVTGSEEALLEMLRAAEADYDAVFLLATAKAELGGGLAKTLREQTPPVRLVLQVVACNEDELDPRFLSRADLILSLDTADSEVLVKLKALFDQPPPGL